MMKKIVTLVALIAILFGCALAQSEPVQATIKLEVYPSSSIWWIAVDPVGDGNLTATVEIKEASSSAWSAMTGNPSWGYWQYACTHNNGFNLPLSFRLTSTSGQQIVASNVLTTIGGEVDTKVQYSSNQGQPSTSAPAAPTQHATQAPTQKATPAPTPVPTQKATAAPTQKATPAPTPAPTQKATPAPTQKATSAPTQKATSAPTQKATVAPTPSSGSSDLCSITPTSSEPLKILVPLYTDPTDPGNPWDQLLTAAATGVPIMAIINPDDGPVASGPDSSYTTYMKKFADAGIEMVGYVHTLYGDRALADVEADVATYASKYPGLIGIFVDEASGDASELSYYTSLFNSIKSHSGYVNTILNPGVQPDEGYLNAGTNIMVFENPGSSWKSSLLSSWVNCAPDAAEKPDYKYRFSGIAYNAAQSTMPTLLSEMAASGIGMVYVTDGPSGCCTYNSLTSYFPALATAVNALN